MSNYWNIPGVPHKGWSLDDVEDIRADGQSEWETDYETCMMCGNDKIRYVHILSHPDHDGEMRVGCNCAVKMTNDYSSEHRERELKNRASRRSNWVNKDWHISRNGNRTLLVNGNRITIFRDQKSGKYKVCIKDQFGNKKFDTLQEAKMAAFNGIEFYKEKGEW